MKACFDRLGTFEKDRIETVSAVAYLNTLDKLASFDSFHGARTFIGFFLDIIEERISSLTEYDLMTTLDYVSNKYPYRSNLTLKLLEKIKLNLIHGSDALSRSLNYKLIKIIKRLDGILDLKELETITLDDQASKLMKLDMNFRYYTILIETFNKMNVVLTLKLAEAINKRTMDLNILDEYE